LFRDNLGFVWHRGASTQLFEGVMKVLTELFPAIQQAGLFLVDKFGAPTLTYTEKGPNDFVSNADHGANDILVAAIRIRFPGYAIWSEEGPHEENAHGRFIIDPLDGTHNFRLGKAEWAISIALELNGEICEGLVFNPLSGQIFSAGPRDAWYGIRPGRKRRIHTNDAQVLKGAYISYTPGYTTPETRIDLVVRTLKEAGVARVMNDWCPAYSLGLFALGKIHGCIMEGPSLHDYAAGAHIAQVAGAHRIELPDHPYPGGNFILGCTPAIAEQLLTLLPEH
jgi:myo-inositol-1(or 4)-monophosphatase